MHGCRGPGSRNGRARDAIPPVASPRTRRFRPACERDGSLAADAKERASDRNARGTVARTWPSTPRSLTGILVRMLNQLVRYAPVLAMLREERGTILEAGSGQLGISQFLGRRVTGL